MMKPPLHLMNRNFLLLWQGQLISQIGNQIAIVATLFWIKQTTGSATIVGLILMASALPAIFFGPIGGTLADRYSRRKIIVYGDIISGIAVLSLAILLFLAPNAINIILIWLFVVSSMVALVGSLFRPAIAAAIPDLVPQNRVASANSLNEASVQIATFIGQGLGGILFGLWGTPVLFLVNGLTYIFSGISESFISIPQVSKEANWRHVLRSFWADTLVGFRYVWQKPGLQPLFLTAATLNFSAIPIFVLLPFYVEDVLQVSANWYGFLMAAFGAGSLLGYILASRLSFLGKTRSTIMVFLVLGNAMMRVGLGFVQFPPIALALMFVWGITLGLITIVAITIIQLTTPSEMRGRVFGFLIALSNALTPVAMGLSGLIADWTEQNIPLIYVACGIISFFIALSLLMNRQLYNFLAYEQ